MNTSSNSYVFYLDLESCHFPILIIYRNMDQPEYLLLFYWKTREHKKFNDKHRQINKNRDISLDYEITKSWTDS